MMKARSREVMIYIWRGHMFGSISTIVGYLMPNPVFKYILYDF